MIENYSTRIEKLKEQATELLNELNELPIEHSDDSKAKLMKTLPSYGPEVFNLPDNTYFKYKGNVCRVYNKCKHCCFYDSHFCRHCLDHDRKKVFEVVL